MVAGRTCRCTCRSSTVPCSHCRHHYWWEWLFYSCDHTSYFNFIMTPDILVGGLRFHGDSSIFFLFSSANLRARWTELSQNQPHARKWVRFENACSKSKVFPLPTNRGPKTTFFRRLRNLMATLTPTSSERNRIYMIGQMRCKLQGVSYIISECHKLRSKTASNWTASFTHPP